MNTKIISTACFLLITAILLVATTSIATECYNENTSFKDKKKDNFTFLIVTLVSAILMILSALSIIFLGFKAD
jgi:TRAP-type C4-dicarboxylate transport system permease small subunit